MAGFSVSICGVIASFLMFYVTGNAFVFHMRKMRSTRVAFSCHLYFFVFLMLYIYH